MKSAKARVKRPAPAAQPPGAARPSKISKTIRLDRELVDWLVAEAERRGGKYQTLINLILREAMQDSAALLTEEQVRLIVREEMARRAS